MKNWKKKGSKHLSKHSGADLWMHKGEGTSEPQQTPF